jgi:hypothetical protein
MGSYSVEHKATDKPWVPTSQLDMAKTRWDGKARQHLDAQWAGKLVKSATYPAMKICQKSNPTKVFSTFIEVLNRQ